MTKNTRNKRHNYYRYVFKPARNKARLQKLKEAIIKGEIFSNE